MTESLKDSPLLISVSNPPIPLSALPEKEPLHILILSDLHIPLGAEQKKAILANRSFLQAQDWVVLLGDLTACYGTPGEYRQVSEFIASLDRPYSVVNGNHEFSFVPCEDGSAEYGKRWDRGAPEIQQSQLQRFEEFYRLDSRFQVHHHLFAGFCLLGMDEIVEDSSGLLSPEHEAWFGDVLDAMEGVPLLVFCHFPLMTEALNSIRYYREGMRPYYRPADETRARLARRERPTFWFSGHVHFRPPHPLLTPYLTEDRVWQIHCPDSWGFGRPNNESWRPERYDGLFVRTIELERGRLRLATVDLVQGCIVSRDAFDILSELGV